MRPAIATPDRLLAGVGSWLEHGAALAAWLRVRPSRGMRFSTRVQTRARLAKVVSPAPRPPLQLRLSPQLSCGWRLGGQREDTPCHTV